MIIHRRDIHGLIVFLNAVCSIQHVMARCKCGSLVTTRNCRGGCAFKTGEQTGEHAYQRCSGTCLPLEWYCVLFRVHDTVCDYRRISFIVAGALFAADVARGRIRIALPASGWLRYATLAWVIWALGLYTIVGWLAGHSYPGGPLPTAPCPTTILAIALLATSVVTLKTDRLYFAVLFAMLLWWAFFAGIFAPVLYGFYVDLTLLAAGIYGLLVIRKYRQNPGQTETGSGGRTLP